MKQFYPEYLMTKLSKKATQMVETIEELKLGGYEITLKDGYIFAEIQTNKCAFGTIKELKALTKLSNIIKAPATEIKNEDDTTDLFKNSVPKWKDDIEKVEQTENGYTVTLKDGHKFGNSGLSVKTFSCLKEAQIMSKVTAFGYGHVDHIEICEGYNRVYLEEKSLFYHNKKRYADFKTITELNKLLKRGAYASIECVVYENDSKNYVLNISYRILFNHLADLNSTLLFDGFGTAKAKKQAYIHLNNMKKATNSIVEYYPNEKENLASLWSSLLTDFPALQRNYAFYKQMFDNLECDFFSAEKQIERQNKRFEGVKFEVQPKKETEVKETEVKETEETKNIEDKELDSLTLKEVQDFVKETEVFQNAKPVDMDKYVLITPDKRIFVKAPKAFSFSKRSIQKDSTILFNNLKEIKEALNNDRTVRLQFKAPNAYAMIDGKIKPIASRRKMGATPFLLGL